MNFFRKKKIVEHLIGSETDEPLYERLVNIMIQHGAVKITSTDAHGGSQDIRVVSFDLKGSKVKIIRETYVGLSIVGEGQLIDPILAELSR